MSPDISVIITCHHEGPLAHKSLLSFDIIRRYTQERGLKVEWIIVLDDANQETKEAVQDAKVLTAQDQLFEVAFKDPGLSRNFGISKARGKYIAIFDGDDFYSKNWLYEAYQAAETADEKTLFHLEYVVAFDQECYWIKQPNQTEQSTFNLLSHNLWACPVFGRKTIFEAVPYQTAQAGSGFGYEDWHWNCETIANGIHHQVVTDTTLFYRVKVQGSRGKEDYRLYSLMQPSSLFNQLGQYNAKK